MKIAQATAAGQLGMFAKVSIYDFDSNCVIIVYAQNFTNKKEVMDLEGKIRGVGVESRMSFKPSVYTVLNIYGNNEWDLKTGIYTSQWDPVRNISVKQDKTK